MKTPKEKSEELSKAILTEFTEFNYIQVCKVVNLICNTIISEAVENPSTWMQPFYFDVREEGMKTMRKEHEKYMADLTTKMES